MRPLLRLSRKMELTFHAVSSTFPFTDCIFYQIYSLLRPLSFLSECSLCSRQRICTVPFYFSPMGSCKFHSMSSCLSAPEPSFVHAFGLTNASHCPCLPALRTNSSCLCASRTNNLCLAAHEPLFCSCLWPYEHFLLSMPSGPTETSCLWPSVSGSYHCSLETLFL